MGGRWKVKLAASAIDAGQPSHDSKFSRGSLGGIARFPAPHRATEAKEKVRDVRDPAIRPVHGNSRRCHIAISNPYLEKWSWSNWAALFTHSLIMPRSSSNALPAASLLSMVEGGGPR